MNTLTNLGSPVSSNTPVTKNFNLTFDTKSYIPDFVYSSMCSEETQDCDNICSNRVYSPVVGGYVHDPYNGKVFCPFGKGDSFNQSIVYDQSFLNQFNINTTPNYATSTWGHAPQLDPRPLSRIGLDFRTS